MQLNSVNQNQPNLTSLKGAKKGNLHNPSDAPNSSDLLPDNQECTSPSPFRGELLRLFLSDDEARYLMRRRKRRRLTECLELLETKGLVGDGAIFVLSAVGGES